MSIKKRMLEFIEYLDIPVSKFERNTGLSNAYVAKMNDALKWQTVRKIKKVYPQINTTWLVDGVGEMIMKEITSKVEDEMPGYTWKEIERLKGKVEILEKQLKECREELIQIIREKR